MTGGHTVRGSHGQAPPGSWRLLAPALLAWAIAAAAVALPGSGRAVILFGGLFGTIAVGVFLLTSRRRVRGESGERRNPVQGFLAPVLIGCAVVLVLGARIDAGDRARSDPGLQNAADTGSTVELDGVLAGYPGVDARGNAWVAAETRAPAGQVPLVVWCGEATLPASTEEEKATSAEELRSCGGASWGPGSRVRIRGTLVRLDPGGGAPYGVRVGQAEDAVTAGPIQTTAARLRTGLRETAARTPGGTLVPGLAVGDTVLVTPEIDRTMRDSSLTHLVAVSGANCALVTSAVAWALGWLGAGRRVRILAQAVALAGFVVVVGPDPSVQRAAVMATVVLVSNYGGRRAVALPTLGAAIIILLVRDPWQALHPGFVLSVAATAGILLAVPLIRAWLLRLGRLPGWLALPVAVACAAQFACAPFLLFLQPGLPVIGVLANVLAAPAAPVGTGAGLLALLVIPISPGLGDALVRVSGLAGRWLESTAAVTAGLPGARIPWPEGWPGAILLAGVEAALVLAWWLGSGHADQSGGRVPWAGSAQVTRALRRWSWGLAGVGLGALLGPTLMSPLATRASTPADWSVVACDVGQGDALLVRDPAEPEQVILVDTGDDPDALEACLAMFGVRRIALLVVSHDHQDHFGAIDTVLGRIDRALVAPANRADGSDRPLLRTLAAAGVPFDLAAAGMSGSDSGAGWRVLGPADGRVPTDANAASVVVTVQAGQLSVLFLGDTGASVQAELLRAADVEADIVKVAHHGSRDQDPTLPQRVAADLALVSVGADNSYGHPVMETLADLRATGTEVARTDELGHIAVGGRPGAVRVWGSDAAGR